MLPEIEQLISEYNSVSPFMAFRELATYEREMWKKITDIPSTLRKNGDSRALDITKWFSKHTIAVGYEVHIRNKLLAFGDVADNLIKRIEAKNIAPASAYGILRRAGIQASTTGESLADAVAKETAKYDRLPIVTRNKDGVLIRKKRQNKRRRRRVAAPTQLTSARPELEFWNSIRQQLEDFFNDRLKDTDSGTVKELTDELYGAMRALSSDFRRALANAEERNAYYAKHRKKMHVSQEALEAACAACNVDIPEPGKPVDLERANVNKRAAARDYHPDKHTVISEAAMKHFHEVIEGYQTLKTYNAQFEKGRSHGGA